MKAYVPWFAAASALFMMLSLGNLYHHLSGKTRHVSSCGVHLAQLQLMDAQLDTTETALNAAELQRHGAKR